MYKWTFKYLKIKVAILLIFFFFYFSTFDFKNLTIYFLRFIEICTLLSDNIIFYY